MALKIQHLDHRPNGVFGFPKDVLEALGDKNPQVDRIGSKPKAMSCPNVCFWQEAVIRFNGVVCLTCGQSCLSISDPQSPLCLSCASAEKPQRWNVVNGCAETLYQVSRAQRTLLLVLVG